MNFNDIIFFDEDNNNLMMSIFLNFNIWLANLKLYIVNNELEYPSIPPFRHIYLTERMISSEFECVG
jgi:hypothetical protein